MFKSATMTPRERLYTRRKLYELLGALHSGPLGAELVPQIRRAAEALGMTGLPQTPTSFPADLHRWSYGYCPGNPEMGCQAASPSGCLPLKFTRLAASVSKGAAARRQREADFIENELLPCLQTVHQQLEVAPYRDLIAFSTAVVQQDAAQLRNPEQS